MYYGIHAISDPVFTVHMTQYVAQSHSHSHSKIYACTTKAMVCCFYAQWLKLWSDCYGY